MAGGLGPDSAAARRLCAGQRRRLALWLRSLHSGRALSQALASLGSPGDWQGWIIKCVSEAEEQESRDETEEQDGWEIPSGNLQKGRRKDGERETLSAVWASAERRRNLIWGVLLIVWKTFQSHTLFRRSLCRSLQWRTEVLILLAAGNWISFPANEAFYIRSLTLWHRAELSDEIIWSLRQQ